MSSDDRLKQAQDAGAEFIEAAMAKAEELVRELRSLRGPRGRQAAAVEELVDTGRRSTDQLRELLRREIAAQLSGLGLATKADLDALERRLEAKPAARSAGSGPAKKATTASAKAATKASKAPAKKTAARKASTKAAAAGAGAAKKMAATKTAGPGASGRAGSR
jgi:polyhydroxyalkanoate synthesis regulator phasin